MGQKLALMIVLITMAGCGAVPPNPSPDPHGRGGDNQVIGAAAGDYATNHYSPIPCTP